MAWTTPRTWAAGETVTAALMNEQLRDNLDAVGGAWTAYAPTWGATSSAPAIGNGTIAGFYRQAGKVVNFTIMVTMGSTTTFGSGVYTFTLPVTAIRSAAIGAARHFDTSTSTNYSGSSYIDGSDLSKCRALFYNGTASPSQPFTWASGDTLMISGTYEAA